MVKTIAISEEVHIKLSQLKLNMHAATINEVLDKLLANLKFTESPEEKDEGKE